VVQDVGGSNPLGHPYFLRLLPRERSRIVTAAPRRCHTWSLRYELMDVPRELLEKAADWDNLKGWERRELGQELRRLGLSYREIRAFIPVPRGTLSGWCRDIVLTPGQEARLRMLNHPQSVRRQVGASNRRRNLERVEALRSAARDEAQALIGDPFWIAGVVAYWAEGSKQGSLQLSNSDPGLLLFFINWSSKYFGLTLDRFTLALHLHDGQNESERKDFWSRITRIPVTQFRKTWIKPEGTGHRKNVLYNGTARVRVSRSGALLHRVLGWIDFVSQSQASLR
jgi:hypothetical protein